MMQPPHPIWDAEWPGILREYKETLWQQNSRWQWGHGRWQLHRPLNRLAPLPSFPPGVQYAFEHWDALRQAPPAVPSFDLTRETLTFSRWEGQDLTPLWKSLWHVPIISLDVETSGLNSRRDHVAVLQLAWRNSLDEIQVAVVQVSHHYDPTDIVKALTGLPSPLWVGHNIKFDLGMLHFPGFPTVWDTEMAERVFEPGHFQKGYYTLKQAVSRYLQIPMSKEEQVSDWDAPILTEDQWRYAAWDPATTLAVAERQWNRMYTTGTERIMDLEMAVVPVVAQMENVGITLNIPYIEEQSLQTHLVQEDARAHVEEAVEAPRDMFETVTWNIQSDAQLQAQLHALGFPVPDTAGDTLAQWELIVLAHLQKAMGVAFRPWMVQWTDQLAQAGARTRTLRDLWAKGEGTPFTLPAGKDPEYEISQHIGTRIDRLQHFVLMVEYLALFRQYKKWEEKWEELLKFAEEGIVYPDLFQQVPRGTGRMAAGKPNVLNIPHDLRFRQAFIARPGYKLLLADYPSIELKILAWLTGEKVLNKLFITDGDPHREMAAEVYHKPPEAVTKTERAGGKTCFSGDTEILTINGWARFDQYDGHTPVAQFCLPAGKQWNPPASVGNRWHGKDINHTRWDGCGTIEFVSPMGFEHFEDREVWSLTNKHLDFIMTPDHEVAAMDQHGTPKKYALSEAVNRKPKYLIAAGQWNHEATWSELDTRLLAMVVSDGSFSTKNVMKLGFSKERKITRCRDLLTQAKIPFREYVYQPKIGGKLVTHFISKDRQFIDHMLELVTEEKALSWDSLHMLDGRIYLDEAANWDGSRVPLTASSRELITFTTTNLQTANVMQAMAVTHGIRADITEMVMAKKKTKWHQAYRVSYRLQGVPTLNMNGSWDTSVKEAGVATVYCVQVPSGAIMVRRNGHVTAQMNCNFGFGYGMSAKTFVQHNLRDMFLAGINLKVKDGGAFWKAFHKHYPAIDQWHKTQPELARKTKHVQSILGRPRYWEGEVSFNESLNTPSQGTGADMLKLALAEIAPALAPYGGHILMAVHDEVVAEIPAEYAETGAQIVKAGMEAATRMLAPIPVVVDVVIADTWAEKA